MKTKFNVSFIIAILVIGITLTTQAGIFGKRVITRCFAEVGLFNCEGSSVRLDGNFPCSIVQDLAVSHPIVSSILGPSFPDSEGCGGGDFFCCVTVTETDPSDPIINCTPPLDLGEGFKRYRVQTVYCKTIH